MESQGFIQERAKLNTNFNYALNQLKVLYAAAQSYIVAIDYVPHNAAGEKCKEMNIKKCEENVSHALDNLDMGIRAFKSSVLEVQPEVIYEDN